MSKSERGPDHLMSACVCAVVVTYNPELPVLVALLEQLDRDGIDFVVIDNRSLNIAAIRSEVLSLENCRALIEQEGNVGQAAALNIALDWVGEAGYELALLFDQDSGIEAGFVARMLEAWEEAQRVNSRQVAAIGPRLLEPQSGRRMPFRTFQTLFESQEARTPGSAKLIEAAFLITSGSLVSMEAFDRIGPFRRDYFIDNVDLEWCFRARQFGYKVLGTDHTSLKHHIGETSDSILVRKGLIVQHSALRYYYSTRNRLHLHQIGYAPRIWRLKDAIRFVLKTVFLLATSPARKDYWRYLRKAIKDFRALP